MLLRVIYPTVRTGNKLITQHPWFMDNYIRDTLQMTQKAIS